MFHASSLHVPGEMCGVEEWKLCRIQFSRKATAAAAAAINTRNKTKRTIKIKQKYV